MNRSLKTLLLWLLLAALPFQGIAAVMKTACGQTEPDGSTGMAISMQSHHHHHDDDALHSAHSAHAAAVDDAAAKPSPDKPSDAKHSHTACSACASCCVGAVAPPSTSDAISSCSNSLPAVTSPPPLLASVVSGGLERPPKRITA